MSGVEPRPPAVAEAEQAVLGAAILDAAARRWMLTHLDERDFYTPANRTVYRLVAQLASDGQQVDEVAVLSLLRLDGSLSEVGGAPYLHSLVAAVDVPAAVGTYGRQVAEAARLRRLIDVGHRIAAIGHEPGQQAERAEALAVSLVQQLDKPDDRAAATPADIVAAMREAADGKGVVPWKLADLDAATGGMRPGQLIVVASRPGVGKSSLALQVAGWAAETIRVVVASYEMSRVEIGQHHLALYGGIPLDQTMDAANGGQLSDAYRAVDLTVLDGQPDLDRLCAQLYVMHAERPLGLVVVDYLQQVPVHLERGANREQHVAAVPRALKLLAGRLRVPVLALAQLRRLEADRRPVLADLRESGAIEADADLVVLLHRDPDEPGVVDVNVAKRRMGPVGTLRLAWWPQRTMFANLAYGDPSQARLTP